MKNKKNNRTVKVIQTNPSLEYKQEPWHFIILGIAMLSVALIRIRLLSIPIERDEGEYAYIGSLILDGIAPYSEAYNMKLPGTYYAYALFMAIFGKIVEAIHIGLLIVNLTTMYFTFLLGRKLFGMITGLAAAMMFGFMAINFTLLGFAAHATHFVILPVMAGIYYLYKYKEKPEFKLLAVSGILLGIGFIMKQQAAVFLIFAGVYWLIFSIKKLSLKSLFIHGILYMFSIVLPYGIVVLTIYFQGAFDKFWFWTIEYAGKYATGLSLSEGKNTLITMFKHITNGSEVIWYMAGLGFISVFLIKTSRKKKLFIVLFTLFSFLSVCPGLYFRNHYWILILPAVGICFGILLQFLADLSKKYFAQKVDWVLILIPIIVSAYVMKKDKWYYFDDDPADICKNVYKPNPFTEALELSEYIKTHSGPDDKIAILGSEPEIFFYSDRKSASGYIYTYGLVEQHAYNLTMQKEMIQEIENVKPEFLIFCRIPVSWLIRPNTPDLIFKWYEKYVAENYAIEAIVDVLDDQVSVFKYGEAAKTYKPTIENNLFLFRRIKS